MDISLEEHLEGLKNTNENLTEEVSKLNMIIEMKDERIKKLIETRTNQRKEISRLSIRKGQSVLTLDTKKIQLTFKSKYAIMVMFSQHKD